MVLLVLLVLMVIWLVIWLVYDDYTVIMVQLYSEYSSLSRIVKKKTQIIVFWITCS